MTRVDDHRSRTSPPSEDPFYSPLVQVPPPGSLIRSRRVGVVCDGVAAAWQVVYSSTGSRGQRTTVSGTVVQPQAAWRGPGSRPVLTYGVGVHGLDRDAAPSHLLVRGEEPELDVLAEALDRGWLVLVSDGDGLGMPGPHTYGAGEAGGHAVLDIVRATGDLLPEAADAPVLAWGYSEGGRCVAWAAELQPTYAPDLPLIAVAAGGVPSDLRAMAVALDDGPFAGLNLAVLVGLAHAHQDPALLQILTESGRRAAERAAGMDAVTLVLEMARPLREHTVRNEPWDEPAWRELLARERAGRNRPDVPVLVYHVVDDELVPPELGRALTADYRRAGARVDWLDVVAESHLAGALAGAGPSVQWLGERLEENLSGRGG